MVNEYNEPFLTLLENNTSNLYFFSVPFDSKNTNFQEHSLFVPIMYKIAEISLGNIEFLQIKSDQRFITFKNASPSQVGFLGKDLNLIPNQDYNNNKLTLELPPYGLNTGFYYVTQNSDTSYTIALNASSLESKLAVLEEGELEDIFGSVKIASASEIETFSLSDNNNNTLKTILILVFMISLFESVALRLKHKSVSR